MNFWGAWFLGAISVVLAVYLSMYFFFEFHAKKIKEFLLQKSEWISSQDFLTKIIVYFLIMSPLELLCLPSIGVFVVLSSFYMQSFLDSLSIFLIVQNAWNLLIFESMSWVWRHLNKYIDQIHMIKVVKHYKQTNGLKLAILLRNLPINFAEKNYI